MRKVGVVPTKMGGGYKAATVHGGLAARPCTAGKGKVVQHGPAPGRGIARRMRPWLAAQRVQGGRTSKG